MFGSHGAALFGKINENLLGRYRNGVLFDESKKHFFSVLKKLLLGNRSIKNQLIISFVFLSIIPLIIVQSVSYYSNAANMRNNINELININLLQTQKSLDLMLAGYNDLLYQIYTDDDVITNLENIGENRDIAVNINQLQRRLASYSDAKSMVKCITLIASNGMVISYDKLSQTSLESSWLGPYSKENPDYYKEISSSKDPLIFSAGKPTNFGPTKTFLFHIAHRFVDYKNIYLDAGIAIISLDEGLLDETANNASEGADRTSISFLVDKNGMLVSFPDPKWIGYQLNATNYDAYLDLIGQASMLPGKNIVIETLLDQQTGWTIVYGIDQSVFFSRISLQQQIVLFSILLIGILLIAVIVILSKRLTGSIMKVVKAINSAGEGMLSVRIDLEQIMPIEMQTIAQRFNYMLSEINDLIANVKTATIKQKQAEIHALEAQINPHFIYNTLDTINWIAIDRSQYEISNLISSLAKILRYAVENSNAMVAIKEEIEWLQKYVFLQQTRLKNPFEYRIGYDDSILGCQVHKLLLQPFVENSILHGFSGQREKCCLEISIRDRGAYVVVEINDNGCGISVEILDLINNRKLPVESKKSHIGIRNVQDRLEMYYGEQAEVNARSSDQGTFFMLKLPIIRQEVPQDENCDS